jgi:glycosyltransferase involved in cell wall biosynthesis
MTTILGWSDGGSACEYYRLRVPLEYLATVDSSLNVMINPLFQAVSGGQAPDVVIGQRVLSDGPTQLWRALASGSLGKRPRMIYELDDDLWDIPDDNPVSRVITAQAKRNILDCMSVADVVTVSTEHLAYRVRHALHYVVGADVRVIPNALPDIAFAHNGGIIGNLHQGTVVGWAGSSTHERDFDEVVQPLSRFLKRNPSAMFHAIGTMFPALRKKISPLQRKLTRWIGDMGDYYKALDKFDIGIIPLRPSTFNRSKSDVKLLEYAARRIPIIASDFGPYAEHYPRALMANDEHEWLGYLSTARGSELVDPAYEYARSRDVRSTAPLWRAAILDER